MDGYNGQDAVRNKTFDFVLQLYVFMFDSSQITDEALAGYTKKSMPLKTCDGFFAELEARFKQVFELLLNLIFSYFSHFIQRVRQIFDEQAAQRRGSDDSSSDDVGGESIEQAATIKRRGPLHSEGMMISFHVHLFN